MNTRRICALQQLMRRDGVDVAVYATSANLQYFLDDTSYFWQRTCYTAPPPIAADPTLSGHQLNLPDCLLIVPAEDEPVVLLTWDRLRDMGHLEVAREVAFFAEFPDRLVLHLAGRRVGYGQSCEDFLLSQLRMINPGIEPVEAEKYGETLRMIKDDEEIARLRRVASFTEEVMAATVETLRPGISPRGVTDTLLAAARKGHLLDVPFAPTARFVHTNAPESADAAGHSLDQPLRPGTSIAFDFGYVMDGYCSDYGRSFYSGGAPQKVADGYRALQEAQLRIIDGIRPGEPMDFTFGAAHQVMERHGFGQYLMKHGEFGLMGHHIGIDVHEHPWIHSDQQAVFQPGMVMCIEPKLWCPGQCYLRVEDMVLVTETGAESLTVLDRELFELPA